MKKKKLSIYMLYNILYFIFMIAIVFLSKHSVDNVVYMFIPANYFINLIIIGELEDKIESINKKIGDDTKC